MANFSSRGRNLASSALANTVERWKLTEEQKIIIANLINARKDVLFGRRSETVTPEARKVAWLEIMDECRMIYGFNPVSGGKDYLHMRNHVWSDMKAVVMKKLRQGDDNFTPLDHAILEVIGEQETPITSGVRFAGRQPSDGVIRLDAPADELDDAQVEEQPPITEIRQAQPQILRRRRLIPARNPAAPIVESEDHPPNRLDRLQRPQAPPLQAPPRRQNRKQNLNEHETPTMVRAERIVGLLPVVDSHSLTNTTGSIALQSISMPQKRPRLRDHTDDEEADDDNRELIDLKKQLLMEKIEHFRLMNEKLKLEIEAMRPSSS